MSEQPDDQVWFVSRNGCKPQGPYPMASLKRFVATGQLVRTDNLARNGDVRWTTAGEMPELFEPELRLPDQHPNSGLGGGRMAWTLGTKRLHRPLILVTVVLFVVSALVFLASLGGALSPRWTPEYRNWKGLIPVAWFLCGGSILALFGALAAWAFRKQPSDPQD